jgi:hypothetical protein
MIKLLLIIFILIFIFYIFHIFLKKKENYKNSCTDNNKTCGTDKDNCRITRGLSTCCEGYSCMLPKGEYKNKICINNKKIGACGLKKDINFYNSNGSSNANDSSNADGSSNATRCLPDPVEDTEENNKCSFFSKKFWSPIFSFCDDFNDPKLRMKDICKYNKIPLNI